MVIVMIVLQDYTTTSIHLAQVFMQVELNHLVQWGSCEKCAKKSYRGNFFVPFI